MRMLTEQHNTRIVRFFTSRSRAKEAVLAVQSLHIDYSLRIYVKADEIYLDFAIPENDMDKVQGATGLGEPTSDIPPWYECSEFYQGVGIEKFRKQKPYDPKRRVVNVTS